MRNRSHFLASAAAGICASLASQASAVAASKGVMPHERYPAVVQWFNANDRRFLDFHHPDIKLELDNATPKGAKAIRDFYADWLVNDWRMKD